MRFHWWFAALISSVLVIVFLDVPIWSPVIVLVAWATGLWMNRRETRKARRRTV